MDSLTDVLSVIGRNLLGYDLVIFVVAAGTLCCYIIARLHSVKLHKFLHRTIFLPEYVLQKTEITLASEMDLIDVRKRANGFYAVFVNLTSIFPLLGILGTVISLIPMAADIANMQHSFFTALTSTFWGLVFAIIFKFLDGFLSVRIEENTNNIMLYLDRNRNKTGETS